MNRMSNRGRAVAIGLAGLLGLGMLGACDRAEVNPDQQVDGQAARNEGTGGPSRERPTQVAARVNGEEITVHQINEQRTDMRLGPVEEGQGRVEDQILKQLIELTLIRQAADAQGLAQQPSVMRRLQAARQEVLARAWAQQLAEDEAPPSPQDVRRHYDENPQAFARRQVFQLQELRSDAAGDAQAQLLRELPGVRQPQAFARKVEQAGHRWTLQAMQRGSEQLTPQAVTQLQALAPGQGLVVPGGPGLRVWWVHSVIDQPVGWVQAQPMIEQMLQNRRRAEQTRREIDRLREQARIDYVGEFTRLAPAEATTASSTKPQP